jgi:hypothetical protein
MNWRLATLVNAAIASVTITSVSWFELYRQPPPARRALNLTAQPVQHVNGRPNESRTISSDPAANQIMEMRVESFASVAPAEYYELLLRATPEQIATLASQFNDLPINSRNGGALGMFFQAWAELDGKAALEGAFRIQDAGFRRSAINTVLHSMSAAVAPETAALLRDYRDPQMSDEYQAEFMDAVISRWADIDPAAAAEFLEQSNLANSPLSGGTRNSVAWAWGTMDPQAALSWIDRHSDEYNESLFDSVVTGWSRNDPASAMAYVAQHLDRPGAIEAAASVAIEVFNHDPNAATSWVRQLPNSEARANAEDRIASVWTSKDPAAAAQWAQQLAIDDQTTALVTVARIWAVQDWDGTRSWLNTLAGDARDMAVAGAVTYTGVPPAETLPVALSINNPQTRIHAVEGIVSSWAATDREAAATWVNGSGLSREEKQQLLSLDIFTPRSEP